MKAAENVVFMVVLRKMNYFAEIYNSSGGAILT